MIEIKANGIRGTFIVVLIATLCATPFIERAGTPVGIFSIALLAIVVAVSVRRMIVRAPALRATPAGISFHGGAIIPWHDLDELYDASDLPHFGTGMRTQKLVQAICVPFFRRRTVFKLPLSMWPDALDRKGVRIAVSDVPARLVADLETLRGRARPTERRDLDAAEMPPARLRR